MNENEQDYDFMKILGWEVHLDYDETSCRVEAWIVEICCRKWLHTKKVVPAL